MAQGTSIFKQNGKGCSEVVDLDDHYDDNGTFYVRDDYNTECDWTVEMTRDALIMNIFDVGIDCNVGYLRFPDQNGGEGCGLCESSNFPTSFCQIYVKENACTENEIWRQTMELYPFCSKSVLHRGVKDIHITLVNMTKGFREFDMEYNLFDCIGAKPLIPALTLGPPLTRQGSTLGDNCPAINHHQELESTMTRNIAHTTAVPQESMNKGTGTPTDIQTKIFTTEPKTATTRLQTKSTKSGYTTDRSTGAPTTKGNQSKAFRIPKKTKTNDGITSSSTFGNQIASTPITKSPHLTTHTTVPSLKVEVTSPIKFTQITTVTNTLTTVTPELKSVKKETRSFTTTQSTKMPIFKANGQGCSVKAHLNDHYDKYGTFYVRDDYNTKCDWTVQMNSDAIMMNIFDVGIDCNVGYLRFSDQDKGGECGICENSRLPTSFCQIYVKENACTENEIWRKTLELYPFCAKSVLHRGLKDIHITLVNLTKGHREFDMEYNLVNCEGPKPLIPALDLGPPVTRHGSTLEDNCPIVIQQQETSDNQARTTHYNKTQSQALRTETTKVSKTTKISKLTIEPTRNTVESQNENTLETTKLHQTTVVQTRESTAKSPQSMTMIPKADSKITYATTSSLRQTKRPIFKSNGEGCSEIVDLDDHFDENGTFYVQDDYNTECDWTIQTNSDALIMNIFDIAVDCKVGYLQFPDQDRGSACGLCENANLPTSFCQIYVKENACTENEIWRKTLELYPFCAKSVLHRGLKDIHITLVNLTKGHRDFDMEYNLVNCEGPKRLIPALDLGPPVTRHGSTLEDNCPIVIQEQETSNNKARTTHYNNTLSKAPRTQTTEISKATKVAKLTIEPTVNTIGSRKENILKTTKIYQTTVVLTSESIARSPQPTTMFTIPVSESYATTSSSSSSSSSSLSSSSSTSKAATRTVNKKPDMNNATTSQISNNKMVPLTQPVQPLKNPQTTATTEPKSQISRVTKSTTLQQTKRPIFKSNGEGCSEIMELDDHYDENGTFYVQDDYNTECDWTVQTNSDALIMNIFGIAVDCKVGYLQFPDQKGGSACGLCENPNLLTSFCQIYVKENACTEDEIWRQTMEFYPFCSKSVLHRGLKDIHITLVNLTKGHREFDIEYQHFNCGGAKPLIPALGLGPSITRQRTTLEDNCPVVIHYKETTDTQALNAGKGYPVVASTNSRKKTVEKSTTMKPATGGQNDQEAQRKGQTSLTSHLQYQALKGSYEKTTREITMPIIEMTMIVHAAAVMQPETKPPKEETFQMWWIAMIIAVGIAVALTMWKLIRCFKRTQLMKYHPSIRI